MAKTFEGSISGKGLSIGIVVGQYNQEITDNLLAGAIEQLEKYQVKTIHVFKVPGIFEIPLTIQKLAKRKKNKLDGFIALGCVIKGKTDHYEMINKHLVEGITKLTLDYSIPIAFEVIMVHDIKIARERSDMKKINIGREAATAVVKTVTLLKKI